MGQRWFLGVAVTCMLSTPVASEAANKPRTSTVRTEQLLVVRIYPVADLVVPLPGRQQTAGPDTSNKLEKEFGALEQHLRHTTGTEVWTENCSIKRHESTLSIVV